MAKEYIERGDAFDAVMGQFCASSDETEAALNGVIEDIRRIPAADVREVVHARWIRYDNGEIKCSRCNHVVAVDAGATDGFVKDTILRDEHFCFFCGAMMDLEE